MPCAATAASTSKRWTTSGSRATPIRRLLPHWRALGARSLLILPLHVAGETFGALTLIRTDDPVASTRTDARSPRSMRRARRRRWRTRGCTISAQRANRARDEVLGIVSHDLRNPISAIAMCARVLEGESAGRPRVSAPSCSTRFRNRRSG